MPAYSPGFRSLDAEHEDLSLAVEGEIPSWLSGSLVRNGPGKFEVGGERVEHWFDGLAMLHKFRFVDGEVRYSNRFLRTDTYRRAVEDGTVSSQFATSGSYLDQLKSFLRDPTDNANVGVATVGGEYVALTETPRRVRFDPETLSSRGDLEYDDDLTGHHVTAHLRHDDRRGETVGYMTEFGRRNRYHVYRVPDERPERESDSGRVSDSESDLDPRRIPVASVEVDRPAYIHSFALTPRFAIIVEPPYVVNPLRFLLPGGGGFIDNYEWRPERGTRFLVFDRSSGELVVEPTTAPFFFFHTVNAFEEGESEASDESVVVDLVAYDDATIVDDLFMSAVEGEEGAEPSLDAAEGVLTRFRVPLGGRREGDERGESSEVTRESLYRGIELPRVAPAAHMRPYRYAFGQATGRDGQNGLAKVDVETGDSWEWWAEGHFAGEPIFVPEPAFSEDESEKGEAKEDRGVVLAPALNVEAERTVLVVLDGETFSEVARVRVPHHIPFGFHGEFFPEVTS
ncbi:carotenoid oxygenase family protein [Halorussus salinisoli]|uniref:carotenoid oxygenase family protein n=1 Tax=Halorussus salinisoli TaxID=2558242 RepID=UPI0010C1F60C|nr:carotenoid oxygenase family protein [Halorussus salinisoli]